MPYYPRKFMIFLLFTSINMGSVHNKIKKLLKHHLLSLSKIN